jgi:hypothetical protein
MNTDDESDWPDADDDPADGSDDSPKFRTHLVALAEMHTRNLTEFEANDRIALGREDPFEYDGQTHYSVIDEWDGSIRVVDQGVACVSFWFDGRDALFGIPWNAYTRLLRASIASRKRRAGDVDVEEPHELDQNPGLGYFIRLDGVVTVKDVYERSRAIESEVLAPIRQIQLRLAEAIEAAELALAGEEQSLTDLLAATQAAATNEDKGTSLERLLAALFRTVPQMQVGSMRATTETEEIDLIVFNQRDDARWRNEGFYILVECKNWSTRCGKDEVVVFAQKLRNRKGRARCGVFVSWNGFTSTSRTELLRDSAGQSVILLLDGQDIIRAVREGNFLRVLEERLDETVLT